MKNWMEKYEEKQDELRQTGLNSKLEELYKYLEDVEDIQKRYNILKKIAEIYEKLKIESLEYDMQEYAEVKKEISKLKYKILEINYKNSEESQSWEELKKEELEEEER
jgi:hypothetical protein